MSNVTHFRERIRLESPNYTADAYGGNEVVWECVEEMFAQVQASSGPSQVVSGAQREYHFHYRIILRAPRVLTSDMRILWRGRILMIDSIVPSANEVELHCREVRA